MRSRSTPVQPVKHDVLPTEPLFSWSENFWDVDGVSLDSTGETKGGGNSYLLRLDLTRHGPKGSTESGNQLSTVLVVPVREKDVPAFLNLLGERILLRQQRTRNSLEKESLEAEVERLKIELGKANQWIDSLRGNFHTLLEETRRLPQLEA